MLTSRRAFAGRFDRTQQARPRTYLRGPQGTASSAAPSHGAGADVHRMPPGGDRRGFGLQPRPVTARTANSDTCALTVKGRCVSRTSSGRQPIVQPERQGRTRGAHMKTRRLSGVRKNENRCGTSTSQNHWMLWVRIRPQVPSRIAAPVVASPENSLRINGLVKVVQPSSRNRDADHLESALMIMRNILPANPPPNPSSLSAQSRPGSMRAVHAIDERR